MRETETVLDEKISQRTQEVSDPITGEPTLQTFEYVEKTIEKEVSEFHLTRIFSHSSLACARSQNLHILIECIEASPRLFALLVGRLVLQGFDPLLASFFIYCTNGEHGQTKMLSDRNETRSVDRLQPHQDPAHVLHVKLKCKL